jgi:hypothetical protein
LGDDDDGAANAVLDAKGEVFPRRELWQNFIAIVVVAALPDWPHDGDRRRAIREIIFE